MTRSVGIAALLALLAASPAAPPVRVGVAGTLTVALPGEVEAIPVTDDADVIVSIAHDAHGRYTLTYVPTRPGTFDLRDYLRSPDGRPINVGHPLSVAAYSTLPAGSDLTPTPIPLTPLPRPGGYRILATSTVAAWALLLIAIVFWRRPRRASPPPPAAVAPPEPSNDEQLLALAQRMRRREPTIAQKVRLESLLLDHWRRRLGMADVTVPRALRAMRQSPEAGPTIDGLERYLYAPRAPANHDELDTLLEPYLPAEGVA